MGFENNNSSGSATYATILEGKWAQRVKEGTPGAVERENKLGNVVYEIYHDTVTGFITKAEIDDSGDYGDQLKITVSDDIGDSIVASIPMESRYASDFMKRYPGINLDEEVSLTPYSFEDDGKKRSGISVRQNNQKIPHQWTKDNPGDMPQPEEKKKGKKIVWDWTDQLNFLIEKFEEKSKEITRKPKAASIKDQVIAESKANVEEQEEDDLPF